MNTVSQRVHLVTHQLAARSRQARLQTMRIPCRCLSAIVRTTDEHVDQAEGDDPERGGNHPVVGEPGFRRSARPGHVDNGPEPVREGCQVYRPPPRAQSEAPPGFQPRPRATNAATTIIWK